MRILSLANVVPYPAHGGLHLRILNLLERIAKHHDITLGCHLWTESDRESLGILNGMGIRTVGARVWPWSHRRHGLAALRAGLGGIPPETVQYQAPELHRLVQAGHYDLLHVEETTLAPYARSCPPQIRRLLTLHNVHFIQDRRIAAIERSRARRAVKRLNAAWMSRYEPRVATTFDRLITVSEEDRQTLLARNASIRIDVVPNGVDTSRLRPVRPHEGRPALLFVGSMSYSPCVDAAVWMVREILPLIRARHPEAEVWIVGKCPAPEVLALAGPGVYVMGEVFDVTPYYARSTLAFVPLRAGGGSRLKILEAMALGRAVVSTTVGAEGLRITDGKDIVLADSATALAGAVCRLLEDAPARESLGRRGRELVETAYDWDYVASRQLAIYQELEHRGRTRPAN